MMLDYLTTANVVINYETFVEGGGYIILRKSTRKILDLIGNLDLM
jgi:hypothetical protein